MKANKLFLLLLAGAAILTAGCSEPNEFGGKYSRKSGASVVFGVDSKEIGTRTSYGEDATIGGKKIQAINWNSGDKIRVYSPECIRQSWNSPEHWADYVVTPLASSANLGTLTNVQPVGLAWGESGTYTFYSVYPSPETEEGNTPAGSEGRIALSMPATQLVTDEMQYAFMTAAAQVTTTESENAVELDFYPAFTAFEISLTADEDLSLLNFALISNDTPVAGNFTVAYTGTAAAYNCTGTGKRIDIADLGEAVIAPGKPFTFNVFCLPQDLKGLKLSFTIRKAGATGTETRSLTLNDKDGVPVTFAACHKHRITGQMQGAYNFKYITLNGEAVEWSAVDVDDISDALPQSGQFNVSSNVRNVYQIHPDVTGSKALRQTWVLGTQTATVSFKVFSPAGGTWEVVPQGATDKFTVTYGGSAVTGAFYGHISSRAEESTSGATVVTFTVTASGAAAGDRIWFKTYVYTGADRTGTKFSLDSETQLYDMRGFHYFRIDDPMGD